MGCQGWFVVRRCFVLPKEHVHKLHYFINIHDVACLSIFLYSNLKI